MYLGLKREMNRAADREANRGVDHDIDREADSGTSCGVGRRVGFSLLSCIVCHALYRAWA